MTYGGRSANITTRPDGTQEYRIADHLGSNRVTLENTGSVVTTTDYEPFGKAIAGVPPRKGFIDKEKDQESGLGDFGVRKYDDEIGRFTSPDPLWEKYRAWSPYVYAANNPILYVDPDGRDIIITWEVDGKTQTMIYSYQKERVFDKGTPEFVQNTVKSLDQLYSTGASKITFGEGESTKTIDIIGIFMESSDHNLTIQEASSNKYNPSTNTVSFNHDEGAKFRKDLSIGWTKANTGRNSASALLGHEIIHGYNDEFDNEGYTSRKAEKYVDWKTKAPHFPNREEKEVTTNLANQINEKLGQDKRIHYIRSYYPIVSPTSIEE